MARTTTVSAIAVLSPPRTAPPKAVSIPSLNSNLSRALISRQACQDDSSGELVCIPNPARRDIALASNPGMSSYYSKRRMLIRDPQWMPATARTTTALATVAPSPLRMAPPKAVSIFLICSITLIVLTRNEACQDDASGDLVCVPNSARRNVALADNPGLSSSSR